MRNIKSKAGVFGLLGAAAMLVAACGSSTTSTTPTTGPMGYNFTYNQKTPATKGGQVVFGDWQFPDTLAPGPFAGLNVDIEVTGGIWNGCVVQLPDLSLGLAGWKADGCTQVPTVDNGGESKDGLTTTFKIDPKAVWSDGKPITADDYLFTYNLYADPNAAGGPSPFNATTIKAVKKVDAQTVEIDWVSAYAPYLSALWSPLPVHTLASGKFAKAYDAATGTYDSATAQLLITDDSFNNKIKVTNGAFTVDSFAVDDSIVLVKNPNFFSNFFKGPFLDKAIFKTTGDKNILIQSYKAGQYDHVENFTVADFVKFQGVPATEIISSPAITIEQLNFNLRPEARNAKLNPDKASIFTDANVRKAFVLSFDRCKAIQAVLGIQNCNDTSIRTDVLDAPPSIGFDRTFKLPDPDLVAANKLLDDAGYKINNGVRTYKDGKTPIKIVMVTTTGNNVRDSFYALVKIAYANLNITVTIENIKASKLFTTFTNGGTLATGDYDVAMFAQTYSGDEDAWTTQYQSDQTPSTKNVGGQNFTGVQDAQVDTQLKAGRQELDFTKRATTYKALQTYVAQQFYFEPLYIRSQISLTKSTIGNYVQQPTAAGNQWNLADWYRNG